MSAQSSASALTCAVSRSVLVRMGSSSSWNAEQSDMGVRTSGERGRGSWTEQTPTHPRQNHTPIPGHLPAATGLNRKKHIVVSSWKWLLIGRATGGTNEHDPPPPPEPSFDSISSSSECVRSAWKKNSYDLPTLECPCKNPAPWPRQRPTCAVCRRVLSGRVGTWADERREAQESGCDTGISGWTGPTSARNAARILVTRRLRLDWLAACIQNTQQTRDVSAAGVRSHAKTLPHGLDKGPPALFAGAF